MEMRIENTVVSGPLDPSQWVRPANYSRYFPDKTPDDVPAGKAAARKLIGDFATRAFRRPVDEQQRSD